MSDRLTRKIIEGVRRRQESYGDDDDDAGDEAEPAKPKDAPFAPEANMTIKDTDDQVSVEGDDDETSRSVLAFFMENPRPDDSAVHGLAQQMNMDPDELEEIVYSVIGSLSAGKAREAGLSAADVEADELARGVEVEMEHTNSRALSEMIALDHLAEIPDYYTRLDDMEAEAKAEKDRAGEGRGGSKSGWQDLG